MIVELTDFPFLCLVSIADDDAVVPEEKKKREYKEMEHKSDGDQHAKVAVDTVSFLSSKKTKRTCPSLTPHPFPCSRCRL